MTPKSITPENKPHYRAWCTLLVNEWQRNSRWGVVVAKAECAGLPLPELPSTTSGYVNYKTPMRAVLASHFPALSKKLFDANDKADFGMVLLWLIQNPQVETRSPQSERSAAPDAKKEVQKTQKELRAQSIAWGDLINSSHAGGHVPIRGRGSKVR